MKVDKIYTISNFWTEGSNTVLPFGHFFQPDFQVLLGFSVCQVVNQQDAVIVVVENMP